MNESGMRVSGATGSIEMMKKVDGGSSGKKNVRVRSSRQS